MARLRTILGPGCVGRLPTVWSNCLAGWWLGGGGDGQVLPYLFAGVTLLFLGGAFLKDAFDAEPELNRPVVSAIPDLAVSGKTAWRWGLGLLTLGALLLIKPGVLSGSLGLALVFCIIAYDFAHLVVFIAPVLDGACRMFVYLIAASVAGQGVTGWSIWCALAIATYVAGAGYFESGNTRARNYWSLVLLVTPVFLAAVMNAGPFREPSLLLCGLLVLWLLLSLRPVFWPSESGSSRGSRELLAGIVLVDWIAACPAATILGSLNQGARQMSFAFIGLFVLTVVLQRIGSKH